VIKYFLLSSILFISCTLNSCASGYENDLSQKNMNTDIKELARRSKIDFDENSKIIFEEDNLGGNQESQRWIVFSPKKPNLPTDDLGHREKEDAEAYLSQFKNSARNEDFGTLTSKKTLLSSWKSGWDAAVIQTNKGFYIELEWVKQQ
jgi:hypothetical protein